MEVTRDFILNAECSEPNCSGGVIIEQIDPSEMGEGFGVGQDIIVSMQSVCWWCATKYGLLEESRELDNLEDDSEIPF